MIAEGGGTRLGRLGACGCGCGGVYLRQRNAHDISIVCIPPTCAWAEADVMHSTRIFARLDTRVPRSEMAWLDTGHGNFLSDT
eukprot:2487473-Prymnesium_polylepis.1